MWRDGCAAICFLRHPGLAKVVGVHKVFTIASYSDKSMKNAKNGILLDDSYVEPPHVSSIAQEPLIVKISGRYNRRMQ